MFILKSVVFRTFFLFLLTNAFFFGYGQRKSSGNFSVSLDKNTSEQVLNSSDLPVCETRVFSKSYQYNSAGFVQSFFELPDGTLITGGPMSGNYFLMKSDDAGNTVWCKKYTAITTADVRTKSVLDANTQIISGFTEGSATTIAVMDTAGTTMKAYSLKASSGALIFQDLAIASNGDKIVLMKADNIGGYALLRLSSDFSNIIWSRSFNSYTFNSYYDLYLEDLLIDGNKILVPAEAGLFCFDFATGDLSFRRIYSVNNNNAHIKDIYRYEGGYLLKAFLYEIQAWGFIRLDTEFNVIKSYRFTNVNHNYPFEMLVQKDGSFYAAYDYSTVNILLVNSSDVVQWSRASVAIPLARPARLIGTGQSLFTVGVSNYNYPVGGVGFYGYFGIVKTDYNGRTYACTSFENSIGTTPTTTSVTVAPPVVLNSFIASINSNSVPLQSFSFNENYTCNGISSCSSVKIEGSSSICGQGSVRYRGIKNAGCYLPVKWSVVGGWPLVQEVNENTVDIQFSESGTYQIIAQLGGACMYIADTLNVVVTATGDAVDLGPDSSLCPGNSIMLNAHKGFTSYLWQDGSTDSTFTVSQPGKYFIEAVNACGNKFFDTVVVNARPPIPFNAGPDRSKCNTDTLHLSAPSGFLNYSWSNNYNISSTISPNVIVNPLTDTAYYVKAEKTPGCFAYDTIRVKVNSSQPISLGPDKSFCNGDSAVFDAGSGFNKYVWSNGSNNQQIKVKATGKFYVTGITVEGCKSYDTIKVNVFLNPVVSLDHTNYLCLGSSRVLDAGRYSSYLWNDGSTSQRIVVKDMGLYAVEVRDANGCKGTDTVEIINTFPLPSDFLPGDTLLCSYDKLKIAPSVSYSSYEWSTGASAQSLVVSQPGTYWLQVKDARGCVGRDIIVVDAKDCMKGCYVPTAFSPNKDGKNDLFRPMLFGHVKKFQFIVYNRWGQAVFQTSELNRGWDGKFAGKDQDSNIFVWVCNYQFEGEETKTERGTVTLVR